jgi:hypothetical protein
MVTNGLERRVWQFYTTCDKNQLLKVKNWESYGNFSTQMAEFQLAGPAADVSKNWYGKSRCLYKEPKRTVL